MSSPPVSLDTLPIEIIRRIATCGSCESALSLLKVNRALYQACNDRLVFRDIIENGNRFAGEVSKWQCTILSPESSASKWARYALADSRATSMPNHIIWDNGGPCIDAYVNSVPQLMVLHHPVIESTSALSLLHGIRKVIEQSRFQQMQALSFCLAARALSRSFSEEFENQISSQDPGFEVSLGNWPGIHQALVSTLGRLLYNPTDLAHIAAYPDLFIHRSPKRIAVKQTHANEAVSILSANLRHSITSGKVRPLGQVNLPPLATSMTPPFTHEIPFLSFMDPGLPFSLDAASTFSTCHLRTMASPEFLEDGEWGGYYCYFPRLNTIHFDPPMSGIRFSASREAADPRKVSLAANGVDGVGPFRLSGEVDSESGRIFMRKRYRGFSWNWYCVMTPYGIVGSWGEETWGGWLWLWKTNWVKGA